jgi:hypothetical protein
MIDKGEQSPKQARFHEPTSNSVYSWDLWLAENRDEALRTLKYRRIVESGLAIAPLGQIISLQKELAPTS